MKKWFLVLALGLALCGIAALSGCSGSDSGKAKSEAAPAAPAPAPAAEPAPAPAPAPAAAPAPKGSGEVSVYNWTEYMPEEVLKDFEAETGIKVVYSTFESNEAMYAKVKLQGGAGYDIVVPSTYFVHRMREEGLLAELDKAKLPNMANLDPTILDKPYDPKNLYSVPYLWGGTGIMYDSAKIAGPVTSWADLWKPECAGKLLMQDDLREVFGIGLLLDGRSINDPDPEHVKAAYERLKTLMPAVRVFNSDNPKMPFLNDEVAIGMIWNGEAVAAMEERDTFRFVWPKEGGIFWMDNLVILKGAQNKDNALTFINYLLRPDVAEKICLEYGYATPNKAALALLPPEIKDNPAIYPPAEVMAHSEFQSYLGPALSAWEEYWTKLKGGE
ncbi:MAG: PotD/PotF family extracellular solute-binding protein [Desulfovibrionaceae bacterium]